MATSSPSAGRRTVKTSTPQPPSARALAQAARPKTGPPCARPRYGMRCAIRTGGDIRRSAGLRRSTGLFPASGRRHGSGNVPVKGRAAGLPKELRRAQQLWLSQRNEYPRQHHEVHVRPDTVPGHTMSVNEIDAGARQSRQGNPTRTALGRGGIGPQPSRGIEQDAQGPDEHDRGHRNPDLAGEQCPAPIADAACFAFDEFRQVTGRGGPGPKNRMCQCSIEAICP